MAAPPQLSAADLNGLPPTALASLLSNFMANFEQTEDLSPVALNLRSPDDVVCLAVHCDSTAACWGSQPPLEWIRLTREPLDFPEEDSEAEEDDDEGTDEEGAHAAETDDSEADDAEDEDDAKSGSDQSTDVAGDSALYDPFQIPNMSFEVKLAGNDKPATYTGIGAICSFENHTPVSADEDEDSLPTHFAFSIAGDQYKIPLDAVHESRQLAAKHFFAQLQGVARCCVPEGGRQLYDAWLSACRKLAQTIWDETTDRLCENIELSDVGNAALAGREVPDERHAELVRFHGGVPAEQPESEEFVADALVLGPYALKFAILSAARARDCLDPVGAFATRPLTSSEAAPLSVAAGGLEARSHLDALMIVLDEAEECLEKEDEEEFNPVLGFELFLAAVYAAVQEPHWTETDDIDHLEMVVESLGQVAKQSLDLLAEHCGTRGGEASCSEAGCIAGNVDWDQALEWTERFQNLLQLLEDSGEYDLEGPLETMKTLQGAHTEMSARRRSWLAAISAVAGSVGEQFARANPHSSRPVIVMPESVYADVDVQKAETASKPAPLGSTEPRGAGAPASKPSAASPAPASASSSSSAGVPTPQESEQAASAGKKGRSRKRRRGRK